MRYTATFGLYRCTLKKHSAKFSYCFTFDTAINNRADMLTELEPEIQEATKRMYQRLHAPS
ncbi:hypothetical protein GJA_3592 [Janthinobacterium agaricidamnosum NBRC 102515 = DSM 9628]|uniref:Uncharacterized protein n=1 Tax=Janthinobacterium agaricidamnosum NBRC 102515 = DSM 9628 TaxID=1349767 RepID=W0VAB0_9BURK|nr:hypothetical protein GJA_3592 [Janthinobacterium agaricidamnosum NBRC 102515 = DSM 9628]